MSTFMVVTYVGVTSVMLATPMILLGVPEWAAAVFGITGAVGLPWWVEFIRRSLFDDSEESPTRGA